jgi:hypothetical protein
VSSKASRASHSGSAAARSFTSRVMSISTSDHASGMSARARAMCCAIARRIGVSGSDSSRAVVGTGWASGAMGAAGRSGSPGAGAGVGGAA